MLSVPEEFRHLRKLRLLDLSYNKLTLGTAWWMQNLLELESLYLNDNRLVAIPVHAGHLTKLTEFRVENNPLRDPPGEVCDQGVEEVGVAIIQYRFLIF